MVECGVCGFPMKFGVDTCERCARKYLKRLRKRLKEEEGVVCGYRGGQVIDECMEAGAR